MAQMNRLDLARLHYTVRQSDQMSMSDDLRERYRAARNLSNPTIEQEETLYHKRQRLALDNLRTDAYKHTLLQAKRREWPAHRRYVHYRPPTQSIRLSTDIRRTFQVDKENHSSPSSGNHSLPAITNSLPPRLYPPSCDVRPVLSKEAMDKNVLDQTRIFGQFDRKFLVGKRLLRSPDTNRIQLILFDQHAVSERILLERLHTHFQQEHVRTVPFHLSEPAAITRNPRFLYSSEQITLLEHTGFVFSSISTQNLLIRAVPSWLLSLGQRHSSTSLLDDIITQTIDHILAQTHLSSSNLQLIIYETLKSLACHNAIKFNDLLSTRDCTHLLNELKSCSMPFICAHGRTSTAVLWEYDVPSEEYRIDLSELSQLASIHRWLKES